MEARSPCQSVPVCSDCFGSLLIGPVKNRYLRSLRHSGLRRNPRKTNWRMLEDLLITLAHTSDYVESLDFVGPSHHPSVQTPDINKPDQEPYADGQGDGPANGHGCVDSYQDAHSTGEGSE